MTARRAYRLAEMAEQLGIHPDATRLFEAGIPERRIRDLLGHEENSKVTHAHYIGPTADWAQAMEAVEALVG